MRIQSFTVEEARRVRSFFEEAGYVEEEVRRLQPTGVPPSLRSEDAEAYERKLKEDAAVGCLARWFFLGQGAGVKEVERLMPGWFMELCGRHGLLVKEAGEWRPRVLLVPCEDVWVASDLHQQRRCQGEPDHILPVSRPAKHLCDFLIRQPRERGLDLCCGSGLHGLVMGAYCREVFTSDLSPRAEMFCRFNAALNGRPPFRCHTGSRLAPLGETRFDLIVSNPPFVITPEGEMRYHANSEELDGFCRTLLREAADHLREGGICQMLCEWVEVRGVPWRQRMASWWEGLGCDVWVILANTQRPETYARTRALDAELSVARQRERQESWLKYLRERTVTAVHGGIITLRRRSDQAEGWVRHDALEENVDGPAGPLMAQLLDTQDFLSGLDTEEDLLACRPRVSEWARLRQEAGWGGEGWEIGSIIVQVSPGLTPPLEVNGAVLGFLSACQGRDSVEDLLEQTAAEVGVSSADIRSTFLESVGKLLERGLLVP